MDLEMWFLKGLFLLVWCSGFGCNNCNMTQVYFESRNFHSRLHWDEVKIAGREVNYSVNFHIYGQAFSPIMECQNITERVCDLSSVMMDIRSKYFIRIMANGSCLGEIVHFVPLEKTTLEAPHLSVITAESSFTVTLTTPMGPQNSSIREICCWERCQDSGKSPVNFIVYLTHPKPEAGKEFHNTSGTITLSYLDVNTEYCGVVMYELTHPSIKRRSENTTFCVTLPAKDKPWIVVFIVSPLVAIFFLLALVLILCQQHLSRKSNLPKALIMSVNTPKMPQFNRDTKMEITRLKVSTESPSIGTKSNPTLRNIQDEPKAMSNIGYAAQDYHNQDWHCHSYTNQQVASDSDHSAESCTSYSMVVGVTVPHDRKEFSSCANDSDLGDSISPAFSSFTEDDVFQVRCNADPKENMDILVLPVSRDASGKLQLHISETAPLMDRSTPAGERTLLLTDLASVDESDWTDGKSSSYYRKQYLPNGVPLKRLELPYSERNSSVLLSDSTSNYRENWVQDIGPHSVPEARTYRLNNNQLHGLAKLEDTSEPPSELKTDFLCGWMVQIQG